MNALVPFIVFVYSLWFVVTRRNCRGGTSQKWYNMQQIDMSGKLPMGIAAKGPRVRYSASYPTGRERFEDFSPNLFWDADPADLDFSKHMKYVVQRVLERGTLDDMRHMFSMYGFDNVVATSKTLRSLDPVSFPFIVNLSGQPKESFRCYTLKQSSQAPWIY